MKLIVLRNVLTVSCFTHCNQDNQLTIITVSLFATYLSLIKLLKSSIFSHADLISNVKMKLKMNSSPVHQTNTTDNTGENHDPHDCGCGSSWGTTGG